MYSKLSIIIPVLNEAELITSCIDRLKPLRNKGHEVIIADGGSDDKSLADIETEVDHLIISAPGRSLQMNKGAKISTGDILIFLHVDTVLPENVDNILAAVINSDDDWGRFDIRLTGKNLLFRMIETFMNLRSRISGIATGDQAMFMTRKLYQASGGFPAIELMEDVAYCSLLKKYSRPICLTQKVISSSRRWEKNGIIKTMIKMWLLRLRYFLGVDPVKLAREYD